MSQDIRQPTSILLPSSKKEAWLVSDTSSSLPPSFRTCRERQQGKGWPTCSTVVRLNCSPVEPCAAPWEGGREGGREGGYMSADE